MQLHSLRHHPIIKFFAYTGFFLIIISFVFFYGWNSAHKGQDSREQAYARHRSASPLGFLPWKKWENISVEEVHRSRDVVMSRKVGMLPPQIQQFIMQGQISINLESLATNDEAVQDVMDMKILRREAERLGLVVTRDEAINFIRTRFKNDREAYLRTLEGLGVTEEQFIATMMSDQAALRARSFVANEARVSLYDLWLNYVLVNEKIKLQMASYPAKTYGDKLAVSDFDLDAYLKANHEKHRIPDQRRYQYVKKTLKDVRDKLEPTPEQLLSFYEKNKADFARKESVRFEEVFAPISADQNTTAAMRVMESFYDDAVTTNAPWSALGPQSQAKQIGSFLYYRDATWVENTEEARTNYGAALLDRALALADDKVSTPVLGARGAHVIRRLGHRKEGVAPIEDVKTEIVERYKDEESKRLFREEIKKMDEEVKKHKTMRDFAQAIGVEDAMTTAVAANSFNLEEIGSLQEHQRYVAALKLNELSEILPSPAQDPGFWCALQIVEEKPSHLPELSEVRKKVEEEFRLEKGREAAKAAAQHAYDKLVQAGENADLAAVAADAPEKPIETEPFTRSTAPKALKFPLIDFAKQTMRLNVDSKGFSPYGIRAESVEGYALWKVVSIETPTKDEFKKNRRQFESEYWQIMQESMVNEWLADKRRELGYEIVVGQESR